MLPVLLLACEPIAPWPSAEEGAFESERIMVTPARIDFGDVSATLQGERRSAIKIVNLGDDVVTVTGHDEPIGDADLFWIDALPILTLGVGESVDVDVVFAPGTERAGLAHVRFDPGSEAVELLGQGHAPVLREGALDVAATVLGCTGMGAVSLENVGTEVLSLSASITGDDFALVGWPPELMPGEVGSVDVAFAPLGGGQRGGVLTLETNDPLRPQVAVTLEALAYEGARVSESFRYAPTVPTDVLFVVEGGAFGGDARLDAVATYAERVHDSYGSVQVTSVSSGDACPAERPYYSEVGDSALRVEAIVGHGFDGPAGRWDDDLVGLVDEVLYEAGAGGCLDGWRRADAALDVVIVAHSSPAASVVDRAAALAAALPDGTRLRVSVLVPESSACGDGVGEYSELPALYGGILGDVCAESWVLPFERFADFPLSPSEVRFPLAEVPVPGTVVVEADHAPLGGWWLDEGTNSVVVPVEAGAAFGAEVDVEYVSAVSCDG